MNKKIQMIFFKHVLAKIMNNYFYFYHFNFIPVNHVVYRYLPTIILFLEFKQEIFKQVKFSLVQ